MTLNLDLLGSCIDPEYRIYTAWMFGYTFINNNDDESSRSLLLVGKADGKWALELFFIRILGPKEICREE